MATQAHFEGRARSYYDENYISPRTRHAYNLVLRRSACLGLLPRRGGRVLDLGCGPGAMTIPLATLGWDVTAVDFSRAMVAEARAHARTLGRDVDVAVADVRSLPFRAGYFNTVVTTGVLEYVEQLERVLQEVHRVLEPDGVLIATMSLPRQLERAATRLFRQVRGLPANTTQFILSRNEFDHRVETSGFQIDARQCCAFAPFPLDALIPASVLWIDKALGKPLNDSPLACDQAKTYIIRAIRR